MASPRCTEVLAAHLPNKARPSDHLGINDERLFGKIVAPTPQNVNVVSLYIDLDRKEVDVLWDICDQVVQPDHRCDGDHIRRKVLWARLRRAS